MVTSVLIVEDDPRCRNAFGTAVRNAADLYLAGLAGDVAEGLRLLDDTRPDVLLVDIGLPSGSGIDLIRHASAHLPHCETMVVTVFADELSVLACIEAGATGYLLKDAYSVDIAHEIRALCAGGSPISPAIARRLLMRVGRADGGQPGAHATTPAATRGTAPGAATAADPADTRPHPLSAQEQSVLAYSARGYSYDETAQLMGLSRHTVETYVKRIYRKLQVHSKTEAVFEARAQGWMRD
jgi:DNA-binding NarL/FixJ family response regulator